MTLSAVLVLAGCGASSTSAPTTLVATLGDSITAGSPGYDPDPRMRETLGFGADEKSQWQYWAQKAHPACASATAASTASAPTRSPGDWTSARRTREVLVVQGGINDIAQGRPVETAAENLRRDGRARQGSSASRWPSRACCPGTTAIPRPTRRSAG